MNFAWNRYQDAASSEAINLAKSVEALLHPEHIAKLSGSSEDLDKPEYTSAKRSLIRLLETMNTLRFAYLLGEKDGNMVFLLDSEFPDSPDYSPPGQIYYEATESDWKPFLLGETVVTEPLSDRWGTWISALVPVEDPISGEIIAVLGLDYDASAWQARIWSQMILDFIIVCIGIVLFIALLRIWLQHLRLKFLSKKIEWNEAIYHSIFEQAPIGIAVVNNKTTASQSLMGDISVNPRFVQILQRTSQELQKTAWTEITHPDDLQADVSQFEQFQKGEISGYAMEKRYIRPDGSSIWTNMKVSQLVGLPYSHTMHLCLLEDISGRKEAQDKLRESKRSKSLLVSNLPGLAYRCNYDREWTMQFVSNGCFKLTGYSPDMLINNKEIGSSVV